MSDVEITIHNVSIFSDVKGDTVQPKECMSTLTREFRWNAKKPASNQGEEQHIHKRQ